MEEWQRELRRIRRDETADSYRRALHVAETEPLRRKYVCQITRQDVAECVARVHKRGKERQAEMVLVSFKSFLGFLADDARSRSTSVQKGLLDDLKAPERTMIEEIDEGNATRVPTGPDVGRIVRAFRDDSSCIKERDRLAGLLTVYSVQRRKTVASARIADFEQVDGQWVWKIPPLHRKTASMKARRGRDVGMHVIPLNGDAVRVFERARVMAKAADSAYLFPSMRLRRKDQPSDHADPATITHTFADVAGNDCSPHDMRRAFGTSFANAAGLATSDVKLILDHNEGASHDDVTVNHYSFLAQVQRKNAMLRPWIEWIEKYVAMRD